jgi:hypothetical protein
MDVEDNWRKSGENSLRPWNIAWNVIRLPLVAALGSPRTFSSLPFGAAQWGERTSSPCANWNAPGSPPATPDRDPPFYAFGSPAANAFGDTVVVPQRGLFLTAACDVQENPPRLEVKVKAWGRGRENWSIGYWILQAFHENGQELLVSARELWDSWTSYSIATGRMNPAINCRSCASVSTPAGIRNRSTNSRGLATISSITGRRASSWWRSGRCADRGDTSHEQSRSCLPSLGLAALPERRSGPDSLIWLS